MKVKPWQMAVIVIGLLVGVGSMIWQMVNSDGVDLKHQYTLIDVESGDLFDVDSTKVRLMLPAKHPETGRVALVRVAKDDKGRWYVIPRDMELLTQLDEGVNVKAIDAETGDVLNQAASPKTYVRKW